MENPKKILIVGTGGIGGYYGSKLARAGHHVSFVCRSDFQVVSEKGLEVKSYQGDYHVFADQVVATPQDYVGQADLVLIATKVLPEINLPELIRPVVSPTSSILLIQNGIEIEEPIYKAFPNNPLYSAIAHIGVSKTQPGVVHHQLRGDLEIGCYPTNANFSADPWTQMFVDAGVKAKVSVDIERSRWKKLIWNLPFSPISVLTQSDTQEMMNNPQIRQLVLGVMAEVVALGRARGHLLDDRLINQNMEATDRMPPYKTSMLLDFINGRQLEFKAILEAPLKIGIELGVPTPCIAILSGLTELLSAKNNLMTRP